MNRALLNPFLSRELPERMQDYFEDGKASCMAFNRHGNILVAGCSSGSLVFWDFDTQSVAHKVDVHYMEVHCVSFPWPRTGPFVVSSGNDGFLCLTDMRMDNPVLGIAFGAGNLVQGMAHPRHSKLVVAVQSGFKPPTMFILPPPPSSGIQRDASQVHNQRALSLPSDEDNGNNENRRKPADYTVAMDRGGEFVLRGGGGGTIAVFRITFDGPDDPNFNVTLWRILELPGRALVKSIVFSNRGDKFVVNSFDRHLRCFPRDEILAESDTSSPIVPTAIGSFTERVSRAQWRCVCFSGDGEHLLSGLQTTDHKIYIWRLDVGQIDKTLEGPKEGIAAVAWHPRQPVIASIGVSYGGIYIWAKNYTENWSAFAPDFGELENNVHYDEKEDEFDVKHAQDTVEGKREAQEKFEEQELYLADFEQMDPDKALEMESSGSEDNAKMFYLPAIPEKDEQPESLNDDLLVKKRKRRKKQLANEGENQTEGPPTAEPDAFKDALPDSSPPSRVQPMAIDG